MIDIEKHKFFVKELQMEVVPYKVIMQVLIELQTKHLQEVEKALASLNEALKHLNENID